MKKVLFISFVSILCIKSCFFPQLSFQDAGSLIDAKNADQTAIEKLSEHHDNLLIHGTVLKHEYYPIDQDWILEVEPDTHYYATLNNRKGEINSTYTIEAEIEPINIMGSKQNEAKFFGALVGKKVWMMGTWVDDNGHESKTELHPITGIVAFNQDTVEIFAFSDDSWNVFIYVPHSGENRIFEISLPFKDYQHLNALQEIDYTQEKDISLKNNQLAIHIRTGSPNDSQGFYYGKWLLSK